MLQIAKAFWAEKKKSKLDVVGFMVPRDLGFDGFASLRVQGFTASSPQSLDKTSCKEHVWDIGMRQEPTSSCRTAPPVPISGYESQSSDKMQYFQR